VTALHGLGVLVRLILRRDRVRLPLWLVGLGGTVGASAASIRPLYPTQASIDDYARLFGDNPALVAFAGPGYGFDDPNLGVILVNETQLWAAIGAALMSIFLVNRHTRLEEEDERTELLRSGVVGRHAPVAAAVLVVGGASVVLGAAVAAMCVALGYDVTGSVALGASVGAAGLAFTGIAAVAAQLAGSSRASLGLGSATLGAAFVLRAVGDIADHPVRWVSPIAWAQSVRAFAGEQWWPLGLTLVASVALVVLAFAISTRRDLGAGVLPQRLGPRRAAAWVTGPVGFALRLQRGALVGWAVGVFLVGVVYGSIGDEVDDMIRDNPTYADFLAQIEGADLTASFFATAGTQLALLAAGFAVSAALRVRSEEAAGRAEPVLATPISRARWAGSHLLVAALGTLVVLAAGGFGMGLAYAAVTGDAAEIPRLVAATVVAAPGVAVLAGVAVALFGVSPRWALAGWAAVAVAVLVDLFGELLRLPTWVLHVSPLRHVPGIPAEALRATPLFALTAVAALLVAAGLSGFARRDLATG
jgi:ABC-2 type transport system permease protein